MPGRNIGNKEMKGLLSSSQAASFGRSPSIRLRVCRGRPLLDSIGQRYGPRADKGRAGFGREVLASRSVRSDNSVSRRQFTLLSLNSAILLDIAVGDNDATTLVNSILGAYGLPQITSSHGFHQYEDFDKGFYFEYPRAWVKRANHLRPGLYVSDFQTADKAVLEVFAVESEQSWALAKQLVTHFVNPGNDIGGDSRLSMPPDRRIKSASVDIGGQAYTYVDFPSETVTRSGYQIKRKNFGVAVVKKGLTYTLVASARADRCNKDKEDLLRHIIASFRVQA